jgi:hypothetical protein
MSITGIHHVALVAAGHGAAEIERGRWFASFRRHDPHEHPVEIATPAEFGA